MGVVVSLENIKRPFRGKYRMANFEMTSVIILPVIPLRQDEADSQTLGQGLDTGANTDDRAFAKQLRREAKQARLDYERAKTELSFVNARIDAHLERYKADLIARSEASAAMSDALARLQKADRNAQVV